MLGGLTLTGADNVPLVISSHKLCGLLAYLAMTGRPQNRDTLAGLLWGDSVDAHARTSQRQALTALRRAMGGDADTLQTSQTTVGLDPTRFESDVAGFESLVRDDTLDSLVAAANLYRGALLDGLQGRAPAFDNWLDDERLRLKTSALCAIFSAATMAEENGDWALASRLCTQLMRLDPYHEDGLRCHMRSAVHGGRRTDALAMYDAFAALLRRAVRASAAGSHNLPFCRDPRRGDDCAANTRQTKPTPIRSAGRTRRQTAQAPPGHGIDHRDRRFHRHCGPFRDGGSSRTAEPLFHRGR
ncbi:MAG: hypothetical protein HOL02_16835 [Rhodospirillaceae bacterium]|nr:hypothetical protein [Rhodospirillaceae bacterium]MBT6512099.1 hypothetical protein [Rhodospirillaceae bacterium]MBT7612635.1 hypothetical protein [Rhodospirillaceae bacterium]MBT7647199.1 hypothetical protein [Rhodospirillaceae bacterium]